MKRKQDIDNHNQITHEQWTAFRSIERVNSILSKHGLKPVVPKRREGTGIIIGTKRSKN